MISARVLADSTDGENRLTTFECVVPKWMLAQINTYGMTRRNAASSRAIPTLSIVEQIERDPYLPVAYRYRQRGMVPAALMTPEDAGTAERLILNLRDYTVTIVRALDQLKMAKEDVNRYLEPWMWTVVVMTATEWDNYFQQRLADNAQGAFQVLARAQIDAINASTPVLRGDYGAAERDLWHLPYISDAERVGLDDRILPALSARRVAGVSYLKHGADGGLVADLGRFASLVEDGHWSALEGPCRVGSYRDEWHGPYRGFKPLRKMYAGESGSPLFGTQADDPRFALRRGDLAALIGGAL